MSDVLSSTLISSTKLLTVSIHVNASNSYGLPRTRTIHGPIRSVAAKFDYTAYSKLAADKISNMGIIEFTYVNSNLHGHFVAEYRILVHKMTTM